MTAKQKAAHRLQEETLVRLSQQLHQEFQSGHPSFVDISLDELKLHDRKNHDYAHGGNVLGNFERVSKILALYPNLDLSDQRVVAMVYAMKQLDAVLWGLSEQIDPKCEALDGRLADIAVYVKIVMCMLRDAR